MPPKAAKKPSTPTGEKGRIISLEELKKHNKEGDMWMVVYGKVYDVTPFAEEHTGGVETLVAEAGGDATGQFDGVGHSDNAKAMLPKYYIGELSEEDKAKLPASASGPAGATNGAVVAIVAILLAVIAYFFFSAQQ